jgi:hypothetical protein
MPPEPEKECEKAENAYHCWHTGSGADSSSISTTGYSNRTHYKCCWCGETKVVEHNGNWPARDEKPHGKHNWGVISTTGYKYPLT